MTNSILRDALAENRARLDAVAVSLAALHIVPPSELNVVRDVVGTLERLASTKLKPREAEFVAQRARQLANDVRGRVDPVLAARFRALGVDVPATDPAVIAKRDLLHAIGQLVATLSDLIDETTVDPSLVLELKAGTAQLQAAVAAKLESVAAGT
jgi:hypothetical protein